MAAVILLVTLAGCGPADAERTASPPSPPEPTAGTRVPGGAVATPVAEGLVATPGRPVLLVTVDTLRWDALGSYGASTPTPALDDLARAGTRFEHAVAHAVVTLPSHASILTGEDPVRHGVHDNDGYRLDDSAVTWAERLREAGYETAAFIGAFPLDSLFGLAQGFDLYDDFYGGSAGSGGLRMVERPAEEVVAAAMDWLDDRQGAWFAWVHVFDPHAPYAPPEPFAARHAADPYAGEVAYVDHALEPLLREARARDAIVVVTSDHGEALGEHGEETHGVFAYAATLRVPLIVAGLEGPPQGQVVHRRVAHIDVLPTVLEALGLDRDGIQGESLAAAMSGRATPGPVSYFEALTPWLDRGWAPLRGLYDGRLKFIDLPIPELYDVVADPRERDNLADERPEVVDDMRARLQEHLADGAGPASRVTEDPETLRRLRSLGYLGGGDAPGPTQEFGPDDDPKRLIELEGMLQNSVRAVEAGRPAEAERLLRQVLERRPDMPRAHTLLASVRERREGPPAAVDVLERAVAAGVESPYLLGRLGSYYMRAGRPRDAAATVERVLEARPDDVEMLNLMAAIHGSEGRVEEAFRVLERALALDPTYARLHANRGTLLLGSDRVAEAEAPFRQALEYDPTLGDAHNGLGVVAHAQGDLEAAVEHWRRALTHDPDQPFVLQNLARTLDRLGRVADAIELMERYLRLNPADAEAREFLRTLRER